MRQFGAAAGSAFAEITLLQQQDVISAAGAVNGNSNAGGATANHNHVPRVAMVPDTSPDFVSIHVVQGKMGLVDSYKLHNFGCNGAPK
jgi:hypothetical protein